MSAGQHEKEHIMKTKKTLIIMLTIVLALVGAISVFAYEHHMHDDSWEHMHNGMRSQTSDLMSDHHANCWTDSDHHWQHHDNDDQ